jgi:hypothetical protein
VAEITSDFGWCRASSFAKPDDATVVRLFEPNAYKASSRSLPSISKPWMRPLWAAKILKWGLGIRLVVNIQNSLSNLDTLTLA